MKMSENEVSVEGKRNMKAREASEKGGDGAEEKQNSLKAKQQTSAKKQNQRFTHASEGEATFGEKRGLRLGSLLLIHLVATLMEEGIWLKRKQDSRVEEGGWV